MEREEILKIVQTENVDIGEYEKMVARKAIIYGTSLGVIVCGMMILLEIFVLKKVDVGKPAILLTISGVINFYESIKCQNKKMLICGVIELFLATICLILYVGAFWI